MRFMVLGLLLLAGAGAAQAEERRSFKKSMAIHLALTSPDFISTEIVLRQPGAVEVGPTAKFAAGTLAGRTAFWAGKAAVIGFLDSKLKTKTQRRVVRVGIAAISVAVAGWNMHQLRGR